MLQESLRSEKNELSFGIWKYKLPLSEDRVISDFSKMEGLENFRAVRSYSLNFNDDEWYENHAHLNSMEYVACISGQVQFELQEGRNRSESDVISVELTSGEALFYRRLVWHRVRRLTENSILLFFSDSIYDRNKDCLENKEKWLQALWRETTNEPRIQLCNHKQKNGYEVRVFLHDAKIVPNHWRFVITENGAFKRQEFVEQEDDLIIGTGERTPTKKDYKKKTDKLEQILEGL